MIKTSLPNARRSAAAQGGRLVLNSKPSLEQLGRLSDDIICTGSIPMTNQFVAKRPSRQYQHVGKSHEESGSSFLKIKSYRATGALQAREDCNVMLLQNPIGKSTYGHGSPTNSGRENFTN